MNAVTEAEIYAKNNGLPLPPTNGSKLDFAKYYLELHREKLNDSFKNEVYQDDVDYTDYAPDAPATESGSDLNIQFDEETVNTLNELAAILNILKKPIFIIAILGIFRPVVQSHAALVRGIVILGTNKSAVFLNFPDLIAIAILGGVIGNTDRGAVCITFPLVIQRGTFHN
jgi:hypothetical protein